MEDFQDCLMENDLVDLPSRGVFFTWSNHQEDNPIIRKLDRALVNQDLLSIFPNSMAVFDPPGDSDHAPCMILMDNDPQRSRKCFKYFSFLSSHPKFQSNLIDAWNQPILVGSKMFSLRQRLTLAKSCCRLMNNQGFGNIQQKTKEALSVLESIQRDLLLSPSDTLFRAEHMARKNWNFFAAAQESFFQTKIKNKMSISWGC